MRKLICLALCLITVLAMFLVGCNKTPDNPDGPLTEEEKVRNAITLKFYIVTDDVTTEEAKDAMQDAFNKVCRSKYSTQVEFVFATADEYKSTLDKALEDAKNSLNEGNKLPSTVYDGYALQTELDEFNLPYLVYPEALDNQIDIIFINSKDMLDEYLEKKYLVELTPFIEGENKKIKEYINTSLLTNTKIENKWYTVPNNVVVGEYKYLLINKELASNYYLVEDDFTMKNSEGQVVINYDKCLDFAMSIASDSSLVNTTPIYEKFDFPTTQFWSLDNSPFALATFYYADTGFGDYVKVSSTFDNDTYIDYLKFDLEARNNGLYSSNPEKAEAFGIKVVNDDYSSRFAYDDDYYVIVLENPRVYASDGFDSMFAVSSFTASAARSMEIIEDLMTDSELCNILLYGVEGSDYYFNEDDNTVTRISNVYKMDNKHVGNVFMTYPCVNDGMIRDHWTYGMYQNQEAASVPLDGCSPEYLWGIVREGIINNQMLLMAQEEVIAVTGEVIQSENLSDYILRLQQFYSGIDPNAEPAPVKPGDTTTQALTISTAAINQVNQLVYGVAERVPDPNAEGKYITVYKGGFKEMATKIADDTISAIYNLSDDYFARIVECKTPEEIDAVIELIKEEMNSSYLFYNSRSGSWKDYSIVVSNLEGEDQRFTAPFGMMQLNYKDIPVQSALAGALLQWYRVISTK